MGSRPHEDLIKRNLNIRALKLKSCKVGHNDPFPCKAGLRERRCILHQLIIRMWRNEVNMRKRERARQQAEELRKMQKLFLLKAMSQESK